MRNETPLRHHATGLVAAAGFEEMARTVLPAEPPRRRRFGGELDGRVAALPARLAPDGLYEHQASAMDLAADGRDVWLATSTASVMSGEILDERNAVPEEG